MLIFAYLSTENIEVVARRISFGLACFEAFFHAFTYQIRSKEIKFMMDDIMDDLRTGKCEEFRGHLKIT